MGGIRDSSTSVYRNAAKIARLTALSGLERRGDFRDETVQPHFLRFPF